MSLTLPKVCSMGSSQTGLVGTIGVTLLNYDGTVHVARDTAGIYEIGGGCYGKDFSFPDNWSGSLKWDTGGGSPVYACEEYTTDGLVDGIWDEVLTGATHNVPTSAGRRLRQAADVLILREETCQAGGANNEVILDVGASSFDDFYLNDIVILDSGTGSGQSRHIDGYTGSTKVIIVNRGWDINPDATTNYIIRADSTKHVHEFESAALNQIATAIFDKVVEGTLTFVQLQRILGAFVGGKTSGGGTTGIKFRDNADTKDRISMTVDDNGNRSVVTLDGS